MNIQKKYSKYRGQSLVEFALVLPVLLMIILGMIESGRLLFIYGSVTTASRQAVRYGSAIGDNGSGTPKYLDCAGIQDAAERMGFILPISQVDIIFTRNGTTFADCDTADSTNPDPIQGLFQNGDRIEVTTTSTYAPIVPLIPFDGFDITTESKRTIFTGIVIESTPSVPGATPTISLTAPADQTYTQSGELLSYSFTIENTGSVDLTSSSVTLVLSRESDGVALDTTNCDTGALTTSSTATCTGTYTTNGVNDSALGANLIVSGSATGSDGTNSAVASDNAQIDFSEQPALTLISIAVDPVAKSTAGDVTFTYSLSNSGNVDLTNFSITDSGGLTLKNIVCSGTVAVGDPKTCTAQYAIVDPTDLDAGSVVHNVSITAESSGALTTTPVTGSVTVYTKPLVMNFQIATPSPFAETTARSATGDTLDYSYQLTNYATIAMNNPSITLDIERLDGSSAATSNFTLNCGTTLNAGETKICDGSYTLTQDDLNAGGVTIKNSTATATLGSETHTSTWGDITIVADDEAHLALSLPTFKANTGSGLVTLPDEDAADADYYLYTANGATALTYTYQITNTGNIEIPSGTDITVSGGPINCTITLTSDLVREATTTCTTASYAVSQPERDAGSIISPNISATTEAFSWGTGTLQADTQTSISNTVYTYSGPRLLLELSGTVFGSAKDPLDVGDDIDFVYKITNTGNTTFTQPYTITGGLGTPTCSFFSSLAPGASTSACTSSYPVSSADGTAGTLTNTATANANGTPSNTDSATYSVNPPPTCTLTNNNWVSTGNQRDHTWAFTNNSGTTINLSTIVVTWASSNDDITSIEASAGSSNATMNNPTENPSNTVTAYLPANFTIANGVTANIEIHFDGNERVSTATASFSDSTCSGTTLSAP